MQRIKAVMITGGGGGIGRATALRLARAGVDIALLGWKKDELDETTELLRAHREDIRVAEIVADVTQPDQLREGWKNAEAQLGPIRGLVTAAATYEPKPFGELSFDEWDQTVDTVLRGTFIIAWLAAEQMIRDGGGHIVLMSSISGFTSEPDSPPYNAAKAGVSSLARSFAVDLSSQGVIINAVAPGWVRTPMTESFLENAPSDAFTKVAPMARVTEPDEIANLIEYLLLAAPEALTGTTIFIDGGQTAMAPMP